MNNEKHICIYCGAEAQYQLKNGKWCCCKSANSCPANRALRKNASKKQWQKVKDMGLTQLKGTQTVDANKKYVPKIVQVPEGYCEYGCGNLANYTLKNGVKCCCEHTNQCPANRKKNSQGLKEAYQSGKRECSFTEEHLQKSLETRRKLAVETQFVNGSTASNQHITNLLINTLHKPYKCAVCGIDTWNNKPLTLELDHIDGNSSNNEIDKLRFLWPNCHSQTDTFRGRSINTGKIRITDEQLIEALKQTSNIRQALISVGLAPKGANYSRAYKLQTKLLEEKINLS